MENKNLDILFNHLGFGNPGSPVWFIGLEEALSIDSDQKLNKYRGRDNFIQANPGWYKADIKELQEKYLNKRMTPLYTIMGKLLANLEKSEIPDADAVLNYIDNELFVTNASAFQANLFPFGKASLGSDYPAASKQFLGLETGWNMAQMARERRFPKLREAWNSYQPKVTICLSLQYADQHALALGIENEEFETVDHSWRYYPAKGVFITQFFIPHQMSDSKIQALRNRIREILNG